MKGIFAIFLKRIGSQILFSKSLYGLGKSQDWQLPGDRKVHESEHFFKSCSLCVDRKAELQRESEQASCCSAFRRFVVFSATLSCFLSILFPFFSVAWYSTSVTLLDSQQRLCAPLLRPSASDTRMPDLISVQDFISQTREDLSSPTTSSFTSHMGKCRNTVCSLEEVREEPGKRL